MDSQQFIHRPQEENVSAKGLLRPHVGHLPQTSS